MGFGHRVFRIRDPRADILRAALQQLDPQSARLSFALEVERRVVAALARHKPGRRLEANIEMDAALLLDAIGLPREAFTLVFAIARAPAWIAHALEQQKTGVGPNGVSRSTTNSCLLGSLRNRLTMSASQSCARFARLVGLSAGSR